ncbi:hypothetical protein EDC96DRAFT_505417 [Choanephora cucurbitarum]|nr:hypothetical protein EDC96DRAFT_505417 [Choanephora cucurbitarum]
MTMISASQPNSPIMQQNKQQIQELQIIQQHEIDQLQQERLILLKEIKSKDKQIQDIKSIHQQQLTDLEGQLQANKLHFESKQASLEDKYNALLEIQQEKYNRRLSQSYDHTGLGNNDFSALIQKRTSGSPIRSLLSSDKLQQRTIHELSNRITDMSISHASQIEALKREHQKELQELKQQDEGQNVYLQMIEELNQKLHDTNEMHHMKTKELNERQNQNQERLKELFMAENAQLIMHCQARVENLATEYQQNISELVDRFENEKDVVMIEHKSNLDQVHKELEEKTRQLAEMHLNFAKIKREARLLSDSLAKVLYIKKERSIGLFLILSLG